MKSNAALNMFWGNFYQDVFVSKRVCLKKHDRPMDTPMFAIGKDEEYYP